RAGRLGDDRQDEVGRAVRGVMDGVARGNPSDLVVVAAAGVEVAVVARKAAARDLETHAVSRTEVVARGLEVDAQAVRSPRLHPHLLCEPLPIPGAQDGLLDVVGG